MDLEPKTDRDQFGKLLGQTYRLWRATPLVGFSSKTRHELVKSLRLHLMEDLSYEVNDGYTGSTPDKHTIMDASLTALRLNDWDKVNNSSEALELQLKIWYSDLKYPSRYKIFFLPATLARGDDEVMKGAVDYPLVLVNIRNSKLWESIRQWLEKDFACDISMFHVSGSVLTALGNWWTGSLNKIYDYEMDPSHAQNKCLELSYHIPFTKNLDDISLTITMNQLRKMHNIIQDTGLTMMDLIQEHVYKTLRIKVDQFVLSCVGTPVAYVSNKSQLKLLEKGGSRTQYLEFLSELCDLAVTTL
ncbi:hypothetical protein BCR42DRAFT_493585 [Absidia repens]|uniref:Centromere protein L n=1 Tax=Absidia repens TaxID=90262 RepID=A0A1X2IB11_9FUNG|nr:hypothetical protein BCR42DRAFT_493585 [Absidia repens]